MCFKCKAQCFNFYAVKTSGKYKNKYIKWSAKSITNTVNVQWDMGFGSKWYFNCTCLTNTIW